jgi:hypothetical protein
MMCLIIHSFSFDGNESKRYKASTKYSNIGHGINAGGIPSRFRAETTAFWREKEMTIFFVSMAHQFPEHAYQAVSRVSDSGLDTT